MEPWYKNISKTRNVTFIIKNFQKQKPILSLFTYSVCDEKVKIEKI